MMALGGMIKGGNTTFSKSLEHGLAPKNSSLSCSSLFSKYIFDLVKNETKDFVDLSLLASQSLNPITSEHEKYLSIGLLSSEDGKNVRRPLNLIIVLDISGSMGESLNEKKWYSSSQSKLDLARSCTKNIYSQLKDDERLGVFTFNNFSDLILPLQQKKTIDKKSFFQKLDRLQANGGTSIEVAYNPAVTMLKNQINEDVQDPQRDKKPKNNRIIFITDAMIENYYEGESLININFEASAKPFNIFTSFIGVGIDFDTDLITRLTKVRGSNYFAVHSDNEFKKTLENDFNYIVTPLCFDVYVRIQSKKFEIEKTFGSEFDHDEKQKGDSQLEMQKGGVLRVETLTAYEKTKGGIKGGVVLVKLKEKKEKNDESEEDSRIFVSVEFEDINGVKQVVEKEIDDKMIEKEEYYPSSGVRKALLLSRYVCFVKEILDRKSDIVKIEDEKERNEKFILYFEREMKVLKDDTLNEEYKNLKKLLQIKV